MTASEAPSTVMVKRVKKFEHPPREGPRLRPIKKDCLDNGLVEVSHDAWWDARVAQDTSNLPPLGLSLEQVRTDS